MPVRLKRLELQGFKSFANRTVFDLADGVTAIVGPNGSGKSNLSEAVRWVLGEQSNLALRGRRSEDVIFAGGGGRAALGMAEVALTLDNSAGELPLDYNEVTIARRIFRDGETHYLINGGRVRLRDVLNVTAPLGQSYTVIGQGLVDAALSARPEERRGLFEHAAGIAPFRLKRTEAERRLQEAEANCTRLLDLRAELEPRLRALERAARHAQEYGEVRERLLGLQRQLYADLWREIGAALAAAEAEARAAREDREAASAEIARLTATVEAARADAEAREGQRRALAEEDALLVRRSEPLRRELAIGDERLAALRRRLTDARERGDALAARQAAADRDLAGATREIEAIEVGLAAARREAAAAEREMAAVEAARAAALRKARELADAIGATERERLALARRRAGTEERGAALARDRARAGAEGEATRERVAALEAEHAAVAAALRESDAERERSLAAEEAARQALAAAAHAEQEAANGLAAQERRVAELRARTEGLQKLAASGEGFYTGVRAALAASRAGQLGGVIGPVAAILDVPADLETALEVALGGHVQDLVVERWADAEAAIAFLKNRRAGRATFQPLDSLRGSTGGGPAPATGPGILGTAADLVAYDTRFAALVRGLLGRTLVVEDLPTTRRVLPGLSASWSVVTRGGEITRASGAVTGGSAARESGILARERALRELPRALAAAEHEATGATGVLRERAAATRAARDGLNAAELRLRDALRAGDDLRHRLSGIDRDRRAAAAALQAIERRLTELSSAEATLAQELAGCEAQETTLGDRLAALERERVATASSLHAIEESTHAERPRLTTLRAEIARGEERRRGLRRQVEAIRAQEEALRREVGELTARAAALAQEERDLLALADRQREELAATEAAALALSARLEPLDAALAATRRAEAAATAALGTANEEALRREAALGMRAVEAERRRADHETLLRQIAADLDGADPVALFTPPPPPLPAAERSALEGQVERLAGRLRRLGPPNPEIVAEWESEAARWKTLTEGLSDVESAARSLRAVLAELDRTMSERFNATFARVAAEFVDSFADLFGGGSARLVLAEGAGEGTGGVEIVAQPPGKRLQSLSLLSGGERALTAAALLFAILRINPSPFCVMDEVDAALDESNVLRFRERLKRLADRTQFVVITHNRGTIEGADTLYGITMGADGVSRILSMRLDGAATSDAAG